MTTNRRQTLLGAASLVGAGLVGCERKPRMFKADGLAKLETLLKDHVAKGSAPGLVGLVARGDETHAFPLGKQALGDAAPVKRDNIFRLASMTKPITAVAAMMLIEEGKLKLDEPVDRLLPELANRQVLKRLDGPLNETVPANRPITVEDVLTFRLGWGIVFAQGYPILKAVEDLYGFGMPNPAGPMTADEWMQRLGALPLMAQPGERWLYTLGSDVLGVLIARAAAQSLPEVFQDRIFGPLGMNDTAFYVPQDKLDRLVTGYMPQAGKLTLFDPPNGMYANPPAFPAGDSGLVSTADDYVAFARFLRTGLAPDGLRLVSETSLKAMKTNHLTPAQIEGGKDILGPGRGWGYGVGVWVAPNPNGIAPGAYGWDGGFGTSWFTDPAKDLTAILLTQRVFDGPDPPQLHKDFWRAAYGAVA